MEPDYCEVSEGLSLQFVILQGKHADAMNHTGRIVRLATNGAEIQTDTPAERLANLKIALFRGNLEITRELFAKVTGTGPGEPPAWRVTFTSVPTDAERVFQAILQANIPEKG